MFFYTCLGCVWHSDVPEIFMDVLEVKWWESVIIVLVNLNGKTLSQKA